MGWGEGGGRVAVVFGCEGEGGFGETRMLLNGIYPEYEAWRLDRHDCYHY